MNPLQVYIGWDPREKEAYEVARYSFLRHCSVPVQVYPLKQSTLRSQGLYWRDIDQLASTEFTYSRFLVPLIAGFSGQALYFDCDFLWLEDVAKLLDESSSGKAVHCVRHDYTPTELVKMDGMKQTVYPRKNWSSLMLFDCAHAEVRRLTASYVNAATPKELHRFEWVANNSIGELSAAWNWLEGWYRVEDIEPCAIHFTRGGPWFESCKHVQFSQKWQEERRLMTAEAIQSPHATQFKVL